MSAVPAGYKQTEVGVIPRDWEVKLLPDVCRFLGEKLMSSTSRILENMFV